MQKEGESFLYPAFWTKHPEFSFFTGPDRLCCRLCIWARGRSSVWNYTTFGCHSKVYSSPNRHFTLFSNHSLSLLQPQAEKAWLRRLSWILWSRIKRGSILWFYKSLAMLHSLLSCWPVLLLIPVSTTPAHFSAPGDWWQHRGRRWALTGGLSCVGVQPGRQRCTFTECRWPHHYCNEIMFLAFYILQSRTQNIIIVFVHSE